MPVDTFNSGSGTWTAPAGVVSPVTVECWGAGGAGGTGGGDNGGGGGAYSLKSATVTPSTGYAYVVGSGFFGGGQSSTFATNVCVAVGGTQGNGGGQAASCTGDTKFSGGNGGNGFGGVNGGGGGGSGGTAGNGNNGGNADAGAGGAGATAVTGGGAGGRGETDGTGNSQGGVSPGGGGGGFGQATNGSASAGRVRITYELNPSKPMYAYQQQ